MPEACGQARRCPPLVLCDKWDKQQPMVRWTQQPPETSHEDAGVGQTLIRHLVGGDVMLCWRMSTHNATVTTDILGNNGWSNLLKILCFQLNINFMQAFLVSGVITDSLYSKTTVTCLTIMLLWWMKDSSYIVSNSNLKSLSNVTWYLFVFNFNIIDL